MESRINILNELRDISPVVARINPANPYEVPQGYFEGLADKILDRIKADEVSPVLSGAKQNPYDIPAGYFEGLAENILKRVKAAEALSPQEEIEVLSPLLSQLNNKLPYSVPAGYFEELAEITKEGAKAIDLVNSALENLSPLMSGLKIKQAYEVPEGYFDGLAAEVLNRVKKQRTAKVFSIGFTRKIMRYAAAAVVAGTMITAGWLYIGKSPKVGPNNTEVTEGIKKVTDKDLQEYVENQTVSIDEATAIVPETVDINQEDMKEMLADISDEELQKYIEQRGEGNNALTN